MNSGTPCLAVILAAGEGKRMKSAIPKPLHKIAGLPMLAHCILAAQAGGADHIAIVTPPDAAQFEALFKARGANLRLFQQHERLGTAHAVLAARPALEQAEGHVIILYGDTPLATPETLRDLRQRLEDGADMVVLGFHAENPEGYGRLVAEDAHGLLAIVEQKDATPEQRRITLCNSGLMAFKANVILPLLNKIENRNAAGEYYLTDAAALARGMGLVAAYATASGAEEVLGVNDRVQLAAAEAAMQKRLRKAAMLNGATLIAPETVTFSFDTRLGADVIIEPHVVFGPGVTIGEGVTIKGFSHIEGAEVASGAVIGPFARLRPGSRIAEGARIGNFVEIKEAEIGKSAKVNHLTYIGDASIGAEANIGAGTITCNYDGFAKHRTEVGGGAFIGSNSSLVAPVRIGGSAYIASGTVVTEDVPDDALAIARPQLAVKQGWAARRKTAKQS